MRNSNEKLSPSALTDETLCRQVQHGDGTAAEVLIKRYYRLVKTCARPYFLMGADTEDLLQEGLFGLFKALQEFDETRGTPFSAFARLCVMRNIYSAVRAAAAQKHDPLNHSLSIDRPLFDDLAESRNRVAAPSGDPESLVIGNEEREELLFQLRSLLSEFEGKVLTLFLDGLSYEEMAEKLGKPIKSVDNAIQRIKRKSAAIKPK